MQIIQPIKPEDADAATMHLLAIADVQRGVLTNMTRTLAQSPSALEGYVHFKGALQSGKLSAQIREQIALAVAQTNLCEYSVAEHAHIAAKAGLTTGQILASREARSTDSRIAAVLSFARDLITHRGECSVAELRENGYCDAEILDIIALVAINVFENYVNEVAQTDLDFPRALRAVKAA